MTETVGRPVDPATLTDEERHDLLVAHHALEMGWVELVAVNKALEEWWEAVAVHLRATRYRGARKGATLLIDQQEYKWIFRKIYRAMIDEFVPDDCEETLEEACLSPLVPLYHSSRTTRSPRVASLRRHMWTHVSSSQDWMSDSNGATALSSEAFMDSVFELASHVI